MQLPFLSRKHHASDVCRSNFGKWYLRQNPTVLYVKYSETVPHLKGSDDSAVLVITSAGVCALRQDSLARCRHVREPF